MTDYIPSYSFTNFLAKKYGFTPKEEYVLYRIENKETDASAKKNFSLLVAEMREVLEIDVDDLFIKCKKRELVYPRHLLRHIAYHNNIGSLSQIANLTNCKGHDTVLHSIKISKELISIKDKGYMKYYKPLEHLFHGK